MHKQILCNDHQFEYMIRDDGLLLLWRLSVTRSGNAWREVPSDSSLYDEVKRFLKALGEY